MMMDLTGQQFGSYRLVRCLGIGGFASVYLGQHVHISSKQAAIKILHLFDLDVQQFRQEAEMMEQLRHPNIVRLLDFNVQEGTPFLVLDYAPGGSLRARHPKGSQIPLGTVMGYLKEIVPALQHAHDQQILHRDIKPDNILIGQQGELLLSDFGIAQLSGTGRTSVQGPTSTGGTPSYMAPEQFHGKPEKASDQYALATVVYEWLSGSVPFQGDWIGLGFQHLQNPVPPLQAAVPALSAEVSSVITRALSKQPAARYPTVLAFAQALSAASALLPTFSEPRSEVSPEVHEEIQDHSTILKEGISPLPTPLVLSPSTRANLPLSMDEPTLISSRTRSTEVPKGPGPVTPVSGATQHRRAPGPRVLFILALVLLITLSGGGFYYFAFVARTPAQTSAIADQWVSFGFDAAHTRNNPYEHTLSPANVSQLKPLWSFATEHYINSSPTVAGGIVYVGSDDSSLYAFDATCRKDCQPLWSFKTGAAIQSSPAVAGGMVYVGSSWPDHTLYAFDATCRKDCQPLWSFKTEAVMQSSPVVAGGMVYVGSGDSSLYAFDATCRSACQPLWSFATEREILNGPAVANGIVYVGSVDKKLYAFDATCRSACQPLWSFTTGDGITSSPAVGGGMVYIGSNDHKLYAFDATCRKDCQPLWSFATGSDVTSAPAIAGGMVYVGSNDHKLYAFDAACRSACQPLWSFAAGDWVWSSPAVAGSLVYVGSADNKLYAFDATCRKDCQPLWSFTTEGQVNSSPAIAGGMVYVGSYDNRLYAFGLAE